MKFTELRLADSRWLVKDKSCVMEQRVAENVRQRQKKNAAKREALYDDRQRLWWVGGQWFARLANGRTA